MKFLISFAIIVACSKNSKILTKNSIRTLAEKHLGKNVTLKPNKESTFTLCYKKSKVTALHPENTISFVIIKNSILKVTYKDNFRDGAVKWLNPNEIKVVTYSGIEPNKGFVHIGYIYNVLKQTKKVLFKNLSIDAENSKENNSKNIK